MEAIGEKELELWRFMADYYLCTIGEVYKLAYPASKTAGEEVRARAEERRELLRERTQELLRKRIMGLEERLARKEAALSGRHNAKVTAELQAGKDKILAELEEVRRRLEAAGAEGIGLEGIENQGMSFSAQGVKGETAGMSEDVERAFAAGKTVLLQGGAARIGVLTDAARTTLAAGRDVLMLVPEISLSKRLQASLREAFGDALLVFHSAETAGNRREVATILRRGDRPRLVLGTRSAIFLPFRNLGLVIVEEEHDIAYKQDGTPRYGARDTAVMLGSIHGAHVLLSSPTPSLESLYNCISGRYALVRTPLEESAVEIVDTSVEARKRGMVGDLSRILIARMAETLKSGGKVLVIRTWGPFDDLQEQVNGIFPENGGSILFSTVHEARRKDLEGISLLAVLNADTLMDKHDFRADEKAVQTLEQFRGRLSGHMLVQTRQGDHPVFLMGEDYSLHLLEERRAFHYPPFSRIVDVIVRDANPARLAKLS
jgi:primosomal protein N' (replication factor Y)